jgi:D-glycero-D-manno-heptose 1,7-bisphosphate phosphatase
MLTPVSQFGEAKGMLRFVLLDRDGVINRRIVNGYVTSWDQFVFLPRALDALRLLAQNDYRAIVVSSQACVGKGLLTPSELEEITRRFVNEVEKNGGRIHGVYYCPHRPEDGCGCRKPKPGLLLRAQSEHRFAFEDTFLIGDSECDVLAAYAVGCSAIMISDGIPDEFEKFPYPPQGVFPSLYLAAQSILGLATDPHCQLREARYSKRKDS